MFESQITDEYGGFFYMLRHIISRGQNGLVLNLKWRYLVFEGTGENTIWYYEPFIKHCVKSYIQYIKARKSIQIAFIIAGICGIVNTLIWLNILNII